MNSLTINPCGGLGEIGSNISIFETDNYSILIDFGMLFPKDRTFEINYLSVNPEVLNLNKKIILFITHGHEDHIGAIPQLLKKITPEKIYASEFTKNLIHHKLKQFDISANISLYSEDSQLEFDNFILNPIHVTHSIPQTFGVLLKDKVQSRALLFISDFKFDLSPSFEKEFDYKKINTLWENCETRLAMLDSTNILNPGKTTSEKELIPHFDKLLQKDSRIFITMFSSNIYRLKNILELAKKNKRRVVIVGRSIQKYLDVATKSKLLNATDYPIREVEEITNFNSPDLLFFLTGCQGEFKGAARRIINGDHKQIKLQPEDYFVFSSKVIPGNEKEVYNLYNKLSEQEVKIITDKDMLIHASGHPGQEDLRALIDKIKPTHYIPIHGESFFLQKHIEFINNNYPAIKTFKLHNHDKIDFDTLKLFVSNEIEDGLLLIQNNNEPIEKSAISVRRKIAQNGVCFISILSENDIQIQFIGLPEYIEDEIKRLERLVDKILSDKKIPDHKEEIRIKTRTFLKSKLDYRPITYVHSFIN